MKKHLLIATIAFSTLLSASLQAATFALSGNYRFGTSLLANPDAAAGPLLGGGNTTTYLENRFSLRPDIVIDDRFTIKTEWALHTTDGTGSPNVLPPDFGSPLDGSQVRNAIMMKRAYMVWASDWGIFRFGRQPKSWGLGVLYSAGSDPLADFGTTVDRVGFEALIGNLGINFGYEKGKEGFLNSDADDIDTYEVSLDYSNPESLFDVGLQYTRNVRSALSYLGLNSSHDLSVYSQKRWKYLQLGAEFASIAQDDRPSNVGFLAQVDYVPGALSLNIDFGFATGAAEGAFQFNPNYQPFMILFRQSVGPQKTVDEVRGGFNGSGVGAPIAAGDGNGAVLAKFGLDWAFEKETFKLGTDVGYATLARQGSNAGKLLGVEWNLHLTQKWYENFKTYYGWALLVPGQAFGTDPKVTWGVQVKGVLTF